MKRLVVLIPLLLGFLCLSAQYDIVERTFAEDFTLKDIISAENGYYVLGDESIEEQIGQEIKTYHTAKICAYDRDFNIRWEKSYQRGQWPTLTSLRRIHDKIYITGLTPSSVVQKAWVVCLNMNGALQWEKEFGFPGQHTVEGIQTHDAGNGDIILHGHAFKYESSLGKPVLFRLDSDGNVIWKKMYGFQHFYPYLQNGTSTADGNMMLVGFTYPTEKSFRENSSLKGYASKINLENGAVIWENQYENKNYMYFFDVAEMENGNFAVVSGSGSNGSTRKSTTWVMTSGGQIIGSQEVPNEGKSRLTSVAQDAKTGNYFAVGGIEIDPKRNERNTTILTISDRNQAPLDALIIDTGAGRKIVQDLDKGLIALGANSLLLIR